MGRRLVITSGKGGAGKTTVSANIAVSLSFTGKRVLLIDADSGLCNLDSTLGLENEVNYTLDDILSDRCRAEQAIVADKRYPGLYLLAGARHYDPRLLAPEKFSALVEMLSKEYDFILIDCPGGIEKGFELALSGAQEAIVVTNPDICAIRDADKIIGELRQKGFEEIGLIINKVDSAMIRREQTMNLQDIVDILGVELVGVVPTSKEVLIHANLGMLVSARSFEVSKALRMCAQNIYDKRTIDPAQNKTTTLAEKVKQAFGL